MGKEIRYKIGTSIREYRHLRGLTQSQLAETSRVTFKYVQLIEGKNPPNVRVDTLERIAKALRLPPWKLLRFKD